MISVVVVEAGVVFLALQALLALVAVVLVIVDRFNK